MLRNIWKFKGLASIYKDKWQSLALSSRMQRLWQQQSQAKATKTETLSHYASKRFILLAVEHKSSLAKALLLLGVSSAVSLSFPYCFGHIIDAANAGCLDGAGFVATADPAALTSSTSSTISASSNAANVAGSEVTQTGKVADRIAELRATMVFYVKVLVVSFGVGSVASLLRGNLVSRLEEQIAGSLRSRLYWSLLAKPLTFFERHSTGKLTQLFMEDSRVIARTLTSNVTDSARCAIQLTVGAFMMTYHCPTLAGYTVGFGLLGYGLSKMLGSMLQTASANNQSSLDSLSQYLQERLHNIRTVKSCAREVDETFNFGFLTFKAYHQGSLLDPLIKLLVCFCYS